MYICLFECVCVCMRVYVCVCGLLIVVCVCLCMCVCVCLVCVTGILRRFQQCFGRPSLLKTSEDQSKDDIYMYIILNAFTRMGIKWGCTS